MKRFIFLTIIFLATPFVANGATEFISVIDPGNGSGTDYTSLSAWEAANQVDLTAATTLVIAGSLTRGTIADGVAITQTTTGATAICVHHTGTQMLISTLSGTPDATSTWYPTVDGSDATNAWTPTDVGDSAIAIAKCRSTAGTADTTAVTIDGWTTSATNYIKVWTDPSENYRHQGKWDEGKYRLIPSSTVPDAAILISDEYVRIVGLQIMSANVNTQEAIKTFSTLVGAVYIENNIINQPSSGPTGIYLRDASLVLYINNNIIYNSNNSGAGAIYTYPDNGVDTAYIFNNTFVNSYYGIYRGSFGGTVIAKNNISYNNTDNYSGTFDASSTNNLSGPGADADIPATNARNGYVVHFADEANKDFHLDSADTAARNAGTILYDSGDDANLNFTTDVDNNARLDSAGTWDIGADEVITKVYRSVGPSATTAIATGATYGNVEIKPAYLAGSTTTITDYIASFWSDLPTNVGVGDALQYDDDDDGDIDASDSIVFITKRIDASHFSVRTASGTAPASTLAPDSNWSIFRAYTSLFNAEAGDENDSIDDDLEAFESWSGGKNIQTSQEQWNIAAYANGTTADTVALDTISWTTTADSYLKIYTPTRSDEVGATQRHGGVWDDTKYNLSTATGNISLTISANYTVIDGLQVTNSGTTSTDDVINIYGYRNYVTVRNSIVKGGNNGIMNSVQGTQYGGHKFYNNIVYNTYLGGIRIYWSGGAPVASYIYNNIVYNCNTSNTEWRGGIEAEENGITKNNISMESGYYDFAVSAGQSYNISSDATATGTGSLTNQALTDIDFVSTTAGSEDLHILPTTVAKNIGTDLSNDPYIPFNTDITSTCLRKDNQSRVTNSGDDSCYTRPRGASWDIGAHELITKIYRSVAPDADGNMAAINDDNSQADTLTIATSGTATFEVAVADIVGVGDALVWDDDDDNDLDASDTILFIHGRTDSTHYTVRTESGALPTAGTTANDKWAIYRAYTSLALAEAGTKNTAIPISFTGGNRDIATNSEQWNIACYANGTEADTTAVTISGWTTAAQNYIKIYTPTLTSEAGISQRHQGKWDDGKYRLEVSNDRVIFYMDEYLRFDGLQIYNTKASSGMASGLQVSTGGYSGTKYFSNLIIRGANLTSGASLYAAGINHSGAVGYSKIYVWNNIIYDINRDSDYRAGVGILAYDGETYAYNNTVINCRTGIDRDSGGVFYAKNNIVQNSTDGYWGTFNVSSDYNLSDLASDAPGANSKNSTNVSFVDEANDDFHLLPSDTGARNSGIDLSQDYWIPASAGMTSGGSGITSDVDGQDRFLIPNSQFSIPDIGADEGATAIYRSVAPSASSALASGAGNNLTISGTTATFASTVEGTNAIGVGDAIQYDSDGNDSIDAIAFISARTSETSFTVQSRDGGNPVAVTDDQNWSIFRAYTTLDNAEGGAENTTNIDDDVDDFDISVSRADGKDIYASNEQWNIAAYANGTTADTVGVDIWSWTTAPQNYIKIYTPVSVSEVGTSQRHQGKWNDGKYRIERSHTNSYQYGIQIREDYARIEGLQIKIINNNFGDERGINIYDLDSGGDIRLGNNIIEGVIDGTSWHTGIFSESDANSKIYLYNNIVYGFTTSNTANCGLRASGGTVYFYNNTVYNSYVGIRRTTGTALAKNNIAQNCTDGYLGTFDASSDYNISDVDQTDADDVNVTFNGYKTVQFADPTNHDYHLASTDTSAKNAGTDLSADANLSFSVDIDGDTRPIGSGWDIGADEFTATQKLKFRGDVKMRGDVKIR